ncbi:MAG TPA: hypothetical protein VEP71_01035, partial [Gallionella sp.]|nr:hypothetical protein [Gallionella sp.]
MALNSNLTTAGGSGEATVKPLPVIGRLPFRQQLLLLGGGIVVSLLVAIVAAFLDNRATSNGTHHLEMSAELLTLTQRLAKDAGSALTGKITAIEGLPDARGDAERNLDALSKGDNVAPSLGGKPRADLDRLLPIARKSLQFIKNIEEGKEGLLAVTRAVETGRTAV